MKKLRFIVLSFVLASASACTEPGETTEIAAATGGVIGAGLGAIVGSQTGDPGAGLVIGAAAGAGTGALIGNSIEAQQETLRTQDEAIERQERVIAAQRNELNELRRMNQDTPSFKTRLNNSLSNSSYGNNSALSANSADSRASYRPRIQAQPMIQEKSIQAELPPSPPQRPAQNSYSASLYDNVKAVPAENNIPKNSIPNLPAEESVEEKVAAVNNVIEKSGSSECQQADEEMNKAQIATDTSDKLFHTRRAIRLCPDRPNYHQSLGEIYLSLKRKEDALFEFQEALKYDPGYQAAKDSVAKLAGGNGVNANFPDSNKY